MLLCWTIILHPPKHARSLLTDQHSSTAQNATSHAFAPKAAKPSAGSAPCAALCPPLLTATVGPGPIPASRDSAWGAVTLGEVKIHLLRGGKMLAYPGKKMVFPMQRLDKQGFIQAGLQDQLLPSSQNRTRICGMKFDMEVEHHCSIPASPWTLGLKKVSLVSHQVLGMNDILQDGHLLWLKSYCSPRFHVFWCDSGISQRKLFQETHLIKEPHSEKVLLVHIYLLLPFALHADRASHTVLELMSRSSRDCYGEMPGADALTSLGFLPMISVESWFHAGLCCHWTRGLITQLFTNWLSRYLQSWFPSNLTPGISSDLLQEPVWKLCAP